MSDGGNIAGQALVVEGWREVIGAPAVALIDAHNVHPRRKRLLGDAHHVSRFARSLESVHDDDGERLLEEETTGCPTADAAASSGRGERIEAARAA